MRRRSGTDAIIPVFVLPFFAIYKLQMRRSMMIGVYAALSLGAVLTAVDDFRSITTIGESIPFLNQFPQALLMLHPSRTLVSAGHDDRPYCHLPSISATILSPKLEEVLVS
jgi:hypothetical protein